MQINFRKLILLAAFLFACANMASATTSLLVVGDITLTYRMPESVSSCFSENAASFFNTFDIRLGNFENAVDCEETKRFPDPSKRFVFRAKSGCADRLQGAFNVLSVANNHAYDAGSHGFNAAAQEVKRIGAAVVGKSGSVYIHAGQAFETHIIGAYAWGKSGNMGDIGEAIQYATNVRRKDANAVLVVYLHGGTERVKKTSWQVGISKKLADAGFDIVVWSHSHIYGPVERLPNGTTVLYGVGNFLFGGNSGWRNITAKAFALDIRGRHNVSVKIISCVIKNYTVTDCNPE